MFSGLFTDVPIDLDGDAMNQLAYTPDDALQDGDAVPSASILETQHAACALCAPTYLHVTARVSI